MPPIVNPYAKPKGGAAVNNPYLKKKGGLAVPGRTATSAPPRPSFTTVTPAKSRKEASATPHAGRAPAILLQPQSTPSISAIRRPAATVTPKSTMARPISSVGTTSAATTAVVAPPPPPPPTTAAAVKLTLKQKLKAEIAALKKHKQLMVWQKQAKERAKEKALQDAAKLKYYQDLEAQRQVQKQAKLAERERLRQEKERQRQEKERQRQEKERQRQAQQAALEEKQQQEERDYQRALGKYQQAAASYPYQYAQWLQERRDWEARATLQHQQQQLLWMHQHQQQQPQIMGGGALAPLYPHLGPSNLLGLPSMWSNNYPTVMTLPGHLQRPPIPPVAPRPPTRVRRRPTSSRPKSHVLSKDVLQAPSPYASAYTLLSQTITLIRCPDSQPSFGVNLQLDTMSKLMEVKLLPAPAPTVQLPSTSTTTTATPVAVISPSVEGVDDSAVAATTTSSSVADAPKTPNPTAEETPPDKAVSSDDSNTIPRVSSTFEIRTPNEEKSNSSTPVAEPSLVDSQAAAPTNTSAASAAAVGTETQTAASAIVAGTAVAPTSVSAGTGVTTTSPPSQQTSYKPRRKRVHFAVMKVMDAIKQNERWSKPAVAADAGIAVPQEVMKSVQDSVAAALAEKENIKDDKSLTGTMSDIQEKEIKMEEDVKVAVEAEIQVNYNFSPPNSKITAPGILEPQVKEENKEDSSHNSSPDGTMTDKPVENTASDGAAENKVEEQSATNTHVKAANDAVPESTDGTVVLKNEVLPSPSPLSPKPMLLQPGDIILKIGSVDLGGMSFAQACQVFQQQSRIVNKDGKAAQIQVDLVVARPKPVPTKTKVTAPSSTHNKPMSTAAKKSIMPSQTSSLATKKVFTASSSNFTNAEMAVLADGILQGIHDSHGRLLGQGLNHSTLEANTTLFRQVAELAPRQGATTSKMIQYKSPEQCLDQWNAWRLQFRATLEEAARNAWNQKQEEEKPRDIDTSTGGRDQLLPPFSSDAQCAALRELPRPAQGCRCQRKDHNYLHDVRCTLYQDICRLIPADELKQLQYDPNSPAFNPQSKSDKDLKTVEAAYKDRMVKLKATTDLERAEARFVAKMEQVQVEQMHKAIFAPPHLATMVLSAVVELQSEFSAVSKKSSIVNRDDDEIDTGVDEEHLTLSGKRKLSSNVSSPTKKPKKEGGLHHLNFKYLLRIVELLGKTWGHLYREPSHEDYAWYVYALVCPNYHFLFLQVISTICFRRWELYHGHNSEDVEWKASSQNPRSPNALSFESLGHVKDILDSKSVSKLSAASKAIATLEDSIMSQLAKQEREAAEKMKVDEAASSNSPDSSTSNPMDADQVVQKTPVPSTTTTLNSFKLEELNIDDDTVRQLCLAAYLLSPVATGLYDELLALVKTGVMEISASGIPSLTEDWATKVDYVVLQDMQEHWKDDTLNRHCLCPAMKSALKEEWLYEDETWALASDPEDVIYNVVELEEWRQFFHGQVEAHTNATEGIGRFGL